MAVTMARANEGGMRIPGGSTGGTLPLARALMRAAAIWAASDAGYYLLLPMLGVPPDYNTGAIAITLYYGFWVGIAAITFRPLYGCWHRYAPRAAFGRRSTSYLIWSTAFIGCTLFASYVLPSLPLPDWSEPWTPPDIRLATPVYFLPKSMEILFQQLLIAALVIAFAARQFGMMRISVYCALGFGSAHLLLALGGVPAGYVIRFMLSAAAFGFVFPYLLLCVPNGIAYSYMIHWAYYAASVVMPRLFASGIK